MHQEWRKSWDGEIHFYCYFVVCQWKTHDKGKLCLVPSKGTRQSVMADGCACDPSDARSHLSALCRVLSVRHTTKYTGRRS